MIDYTKGNRPIIVLLTLMAVSLAALLLFVPPIPQNQSYHQFADQRSLFGIPNFWNVVSNLPFIVIGAVGLRSFHRDPITIALFAGMLLTGIGSSYYHWNPNDHTLLWDRLPITVCFVAMFAYVVEERVNARAGRILLWPMLALGIVSLLLWRWTDDLRLYGWVQFFPCLALLLIFLLFPAKYTGTSYWLAAAALYVLAKLAEHYDRVMPSSGWALSGHTLKHLLAAGACWAILRYFQTREPIRSTAQASAAP
jgi:hypothetical protein